jgi:phosphopantetheinyl transferase
MNLNCIDKIELGIQTVYLLKFEPFDIHDFFQYLTEQEIERVLSFKSIKRQQEFVATRKLRHDIFGFNHIHYNEVGAPYIKNEGYISISHADGIVGIAMNKKYEVSLDLETISNQSLRLRDKFLSEQEKKRLNTNCEIEMTKAWSLKEVLYKLSGAKGIIFKEQLQIQKLSEEQWLGEIFIKGKKIEVELSTFVLDNVVLSCNSGKKLFLDGGLRYNM